jgi:2-haloacid dehalogenase
VSVSAFLRRHAPGNDPVAFADAWRQHYAPEIEEVRLGRRPLMRLDVLDRKYRSVVV